MFKPLNETRGSAGEEDDRKERQARQLDVRPVNHPKGLIDKKKIGVNVL